MDMTAPHVDFVIAAYAASAFGIVGLIIWVVWRDRSLREP